MARRQTICLSKISFFAITNWEGNSISQKISIISNDFP